MARNNTSKTLYSLAPVMPSYRDHVALVRRYDLPEAAATRLVVDELSAHGKAIV